MTLADTGRTELRLRFDGRRPLSAELVAEVTGFADRLDAVPGAVGVLELSGTPVDPFPGRAGIQLVNRWERALRRLELTTAATVAVVLGDCGGAALDVLLTTDYRVATGDASLMLTTDGGTAWPGMGLYRLANQAGVGRLRGSVLFGRPLSAVAAAELSLLDEVVADVGTALRTARSVADRLRGHPGQEVAIRRRLMLDATTTSYEEALGAHLAACDRALRLAGRS
jgi:isomerase DpgB